MRELTYAQRLTWWEQHGIEQLRTLRKAAPKKTQNNGESPPNWRLLVHIGRVLVSVSKDGRVQQSQKQLARVTGEESEREIRRCMKFLTDTGWLNLESPAHGGPNPRPAVYSIIQLQNWAELNSETVSLAGDSLNSETVSLAGDSLSELDSVPTEGDSVPIDRDSVPSWGHLYGITTTASSSVVEKSSHALRAPNVNSADEERRRSERAKTRAIEEMQLDKQLRREARGVAEAAALRLATARENKERDDPQTYARGIVRKDEGAVTERLVRTIAHNWPLTLQSTSKQDRTLLEDYCAIQYTDKHPNSGVVQNHLNSREIQLQEEATQLLQSVRVGAQEDYRKNGTKLKHYGRGDGTGAPF